MLHASIDELEAQSDDRGERGHEGENGDADADADADGDYQLENDEETLFNRTVATLSKAKGKQRRAVKEVVPKAEIDEWTRTKKDNHVSFCITSKQGLFR